jgi:hypothetical protein
MVLEKRGLSPEAYPALLQKLKDYAFLYHHVPNEIPPDYDVTPKF